MKEHKMKKHSTECVNSSQQKKENKVFMHSCISCLYETNDYNAMQVHLDVHKPKLKCDFCDKLFFDSAQMNDHKIATHNSDMNECTKCKKIIRTNIGKERHVELFCDSCGICLPERVSFDNHMSVLHSQPDEENGKSARPKLISSTGSDQM